MRSKIVGVMGASAHAHPELSRPVGRLIARMGFHLLTGGGSGVMAAVAKAFCQVKDRTGVSIGILRSLSMPIWSPPGTPLEYARPYVNEWVEIPIFTHLPLSGEQGRDPLSRNHLNVLSADILVALPGGAGTCSEVSLRVDYGRSVILFLGSETIDGKGADVVARLAKKTGQITICQGIESLRKAIGDCDGGSRP